MNIHIVWLEYLIKAKKVVKDNMPKFQSINNILRIQNAIQHYSIKGSI